jgi:hypothetical protein
VNLLDDFYGKLRSRFRDGELTGSGCAKPAGTTPWQVAENLVEGFLECKKIIYFFSFELFIPFLPKKLVIQKQLAV